MAAKSVKQRKGLSENSGAASRPNPGAAGFADKEPEVRLRRIRRGGRAAMQLATDVRQHWRNEASRCRSRRLAEPNPETILLRTIKEIWRNTFVLRQNRFVEIGLRFAKLSAYPCPLCYSKALSVFLRPFSFVPPTIRRYRAKQASTVQELFPTISCHRKRSRH